MSFEKMLKEKKKKGAPEMSDNEQKAKMGVVKDMHDMASGEMGKRLGGLKKVSVMSDSKAGLSKGLDKAKELMQAIHGSGNAEPDSMDDEETNAEGTNQKHFTSQEGNHSALSSPEEGSPEEEASETPAEEHAEDADMEKQHEHKSSHELDAHIKKLMELKKKKEHEESPR